MTPHARGNRTTSGKPVTAQTPALDAARTLTRHPGEERLLRIYAKRQGAKAAVWYLRHHVAPKLPPGVTFRHVNDEVWGRYDPPPETAG